MKVCKRMKMTIHNRPQKGVLIQVGPIRSLDAIAEIKTMLRNEPRNHAIFTTGTNTNLRGCDLLKLTVGEVRYLTPGDPLVLREKKTGKVRTITVNQAVYKSLQSWLGIRVKAKDSDPLFPSRKTGRPITVSTLNNLVKKWCRAAGLRGNYGSHTLRKTFGFVHRTVFKTDIATLMVMFNHSTQRQTLTYLGIQPDEVQEAYLREI
jgi:integrase